MGKRAAAVSTLKRALRLEMCQASIVAGDCLVIPLSALELLWERWEKGLLDVTKDGRVVLDYGPNARLR